MLNPNEKHTSKCNVCGDIWEVSKYSKSECYICPRCEIEGYVAKRLYPTPSRRLRKNIKHSNKHSSKTKTFEIMQNKRVGSCNYNGQINIYKKFIKYIIA